MIAPETIERIALVVERAGLSEQTISALRESFADLHFTHCMDEDIGIGVGSAEPVRVSRSSTFIWSTGVPTACVSPPMRRPPPAWSWRRSTRTTSPTPGRTTSLRGTPGRREPPQPFGTSLGISRGSNQECPRPPSPTARNARTGGTC